MIHLKTVKLQTDNKTKYYRFENFAFLMSNSKVFTKPKSV